MGKAVGPWPQQGRKVPLPGDVSWVNLKLDHLSLTFLVTAQLEMLGTFDGNLLTPLALGALQTQHQLFGCLCLLPQDGLRLASKALLLPVITPTALSELGLLALFVLRHLKFLMVVAAWAVCPSRFGNIHHFVFCFFRKKPH